MLQPSTLSFIKKLSKNNNKPWFEANRPAFEAAKQDFETLVGQVIANLGKTDPDIAELLPKNCIFRQYRDVRFSKDKTPYKPHMGASFDKGGRKSGNAGYYLHIEPGGNSMVGGGIWMPEAPALKKIRQEVDYNWEEFTGLLNAPAFKKTYGNLSFGEHQLTREPKGYEKDNPAIEYLKLKSFVAIRTMTDEELTSPQLLSNIVSSFVALSPVVHFLNRSLE